MVPTASAPPFFVVPGHSRHAALRALLLWPSPSSPRRPPFLSAVPVPPLPTRSLGTLTCMALSLLPLWGPWTSSHGRQPWDLSCYLLSLRIVFFPLPKGCPFGAFPGVSRVRLLRSWTLSLFLLSSGLSAHWSQEVIVQVLEEVVRCSRTTARGCIKMLCPSRLSHIICKAENVGRCTQIELFDWDVFDGDWSFRAQTVD